MQKEDTSSPSKGTSQHAEISQNNTVLESELKKLEDELYCIKNSNQLLENKIQTFTQESSYYKNKLEIAEDYIVELGKSIEEKEKDEPNEQILNIFREKIECLENENHALRNMKREEGGKTTDNRLANANEKCSSTQEKPRDVQSQLS